jgi:hypothetical protein
MVSFLWPVFAAGIYLVAQVGGNPESVAAVAAALGGLMLSLVVTGTLEPLAPQKR